MNHLSRSCYDDSHAMMDITLTSCALMIAAGIILITLFFIIFDSPYRTDVELRSISDSFLSTIHTVESSWFETSISHLFSPSASTYRIAVSPESLSIATEGNDVDERIHRQMFLSTPWIRTANDSWVNASNFHEHLYQMFGSNGTKDDPLNDSITITEALEKEWNDSYAYFLYCPYEIKTSTPVIVEKCLIYRDSNNNDVWDKTDQRMQYLLIYQK